MYVCMYVCIMYEGVSKSFRIGRLETYRRSGCIAPLILDPVLDGGEWSASRPGRFTPRGRAPVTNWI